MATWITGGAVWDSAEQSFLPADIKVSRGRIVRVAARGGASSGGHRTSNGPHRAAETEVVDATGLHLLPGLIDCHVHLTMRGEDADPAANAGRSDDEIRMYTASAAERTVMGGTTAVRDLGGWNYVEMDVRRDIDANQSFGPSLVLAGRLVSMPTPAVRYYPGMYEVASGEDQCGRAARQQLERGADVIKVMATGAMLSPEEEDAGETQFSENEIRAVVDAAASERKPVAAHAHALEGIRSAVRAGVSSIEHGTYADDDVLSLMASRGVFLVPTIAASASMMRDERIMSEMPAHLRARLVESHRTHVEMVNRAWRAGVPIAMGTDAGTPGNHHGDNAVECVYMVEEAEMTPAATIRAATHGAARLLGRSSDMGAIEPGKYADIIGCHADPLVDVTELTRLTFVMRRGTILQNR